MGTIKMKIKGYDKESHSLLISFASDETMSNDPEDYPAYAFQTAEICPHTNDIEEVKCTKKLFDYIHKNMKYIERQSHLSVLLVLSLVFDYL